MWVWTSTVGILTDFSLDIGSCWFVLVPIGDGSVSNRYYSCQNLSPEISQDSFLSFAVRLRCLKETTDFFNVSFRKENKR